MAKTQTIIGLRELREHADKYITQVSKGHSFTVVRRSKPVFKISPPVDEWGDEGNWETLIDFTKIKKGVVPIDEVLQALKELREEDEKISK